MVHLKWLIHNNAHTWMCSHLVRGGKNSGKKITSNDDILLFTSKGTVLKVSAVLFENLNDNYDLSKYYEGFLKNDEIIKVVYTSSFDGVVRAKI